MVLGEIRTGNLLCAPCPGQVFQMALRGLARRHRLVGILVFELIERKRDAAGKPHGFRDRLRQVAKQPRHFVAGLEIAFRIGFQALADGVDGGLLADAGQHILQADGARDGDTAPRWSPAAARWPSRRCDAAAPAGACRRRDTAGSRQATRRRRGCAVNRSRTLKRFCRLEAMRQRQHQKLAFGEFQEVIELQMAFALFDLSSSSPRLPRVSNWQSRP